MNFSINRFSVPKCNTLALPRLLPCPVVGDLAVEAVIAVR